MPRRTKEGYVQVAFQADIWVNPWTTLLVSRVSAYGASRRSPAFILGRAGPSEMAISLASLFSKCVNGVRASIEERRRSTSGTGKRRPFSKERFRSFAANKKSVHVSKNDSFLKRVSGSDAEEFLNDRPDSC